MEIEKEKRREKQDERKDGTTKSRVEIVKDIYIYKQNKKGCIKNTRRNRYQMFGFFVERAFNGVKRNEVAEASDTDRRDMEEE